MNIFSTTSLLITVIAAMFSCAASCAPDHVTTSDQSVVDDAFVHGYTHNMVTDVIDGKNYRTISIQCVNTGTHIDNFDNEFRGFSVWTRDLYWGGLGWFQAGGPEVINRYKTSLQALITCKNRNKADGHVANWPLNNGRYYIPQAWCTGGAIAEGFYPYDSESQADFLLLAHMYWKVSGDTEYIASIWDDIMYVTKNIEVMDTNGNSLPDNLWGSYDYQGLGQDQEEPLMSAKASAAYKAVSELAKLTGHTDEAKRLSALAAKVRKQLNKPVSEGGLWNPLPDGGGYYVNFRSIKKGHESIDEKFIPYENLVPMFFGMMEKKQIASVFSILDGGFSKYYDLKWGPMYVAPAAHTSNSVIDCSTTPWLGFLDVYLRSKNGWTNNRSRIYKMLMDHAYDIPAAPFTEGAGIEGNLTGGAGRAWDNGNFFHCLINGIYGVEKTADAIILTAPTPMTDFPLTELKAIQWHEAQYDIKWLGEGSKIAGVTLDGVRVASSAGRYRLTKRSEVHSVVVKLR